jgi:hypothetical protein
MWNSFTNVSRWLNDLCMDTMYIQNPNTFCHGRYFLTYKKATMVHFTKILGTWTKVGNEFQSNQTPNFKLLLITRTNPKPKQPKKYILAIHPNGQREYISGILDNNHIDYGGKVFSFMSINTNTFYIE